jgi:tetratricopeptide (TPR) repeat protein
VAAKVLPMLEERAGVLRGAAQQICVDADIDKTLSARDADRARWCMEEQGSRLGALVESLAGADVGSVRNAVQAVAGLPPVTYCVDRRSLTAMPDTPPFEARPAIEKLRGALARARASSSAGRYEEALEQVLAAKPDVHRVDWAPLTASFLKAEASLLEELARYPEAESVALDAWELAAQHGAWGVAFDAASELAYLTAENLDRPKEALVWNRHSKVALAHAGDPAGLREAGRNFHYAYALQETGDRAGARKAFEAAIEGYSKALGSDHLSVARVRNSFGYLLMTGGDYDEAQAMYKQALASYEASLGVDHPDVSRVLLNMGLLESWRNGAEEAHRINERAVKLIETALGGEHPDLAHALLNQGMALGRAGKNKEAKPLLERALAITEKAQGKDSPRLGLVLGQLARVQNYLGNEEVARDLLKRAIVLQEKSGDAPYPNLAGVLISYGDVLVATGAPDEALVAFSRAMAITKDAVGTDHANYAAVITNKAILHDSINEHEQAAELFAEARGVYERKMGAEHPDVAYALMGEGASLMAMDRLEEGLPLLERALKLRTQNEVGNYLRAEAQFTLAEALWEAKAGAGRDRKRALELARSAKGGFAAEGEGTAEVVKQVEDWIAAHGG